MFYSQFFTKKRQIQLLSGRSGTRRQIQVFSGFSWGLKLFDKLWGNSYIHFLVI